MSTHPDDRSTPGPGHPDERRVLEAIDIDGLLAALGELIGMDTSGGNETPAQEWMADLMAGSGMEVDRWDLDLAALRRDPSYSEELGRDRALGVVGRFGGGASAAGPAAGAPWCSTATWTWSRPVIVGSGACRLSRPPSATGGSMAGDRPT